MFLFTQEDLEVLKFEKKNVFESLASTRTLTICIMTLGLMKGVLFVLYKWGGTYQQHNINCLLLLFRFSIPWKAIKSISKASFTCFPSPPLFHKKVFSPRHKWRYSPGGSVAAWSCWSFGWLASGEWAWPKQPSPFQGPRSFTWSGKEGILWPLLVHHPTCVIGGVEGPVEVWWSLCGCFLLIFVVEGLKWLCSDPFRSSKGFLCGGYCHFSLFYRSFHSCRFRCKECCLCWKNQY